MKLFDVYPINPVEIVKASGMTVWDSEGNSYLDFYGGHAVISIGHSHPTYVHALQDQLEKIGFYSNSIKIPLQDELVNSLERVSKKNNYQLFLVNSGAEANENALKLASFHSKRKKVVAFTGGFHGRTSLAVAATDNPAIIAPVNETDHVVFSPFNDVSSLEKIFEAQGSEIAAVIVEGIQGVGGIVEASIPFLKAIRELCDQYGAVFVADSVQCGYGRTGEFFSHDYSGVSADIYTMAKGMGNGFPIGGLLIHDSIIPSFGLLGTTFGGNHLACRAAIAVLEVFQQEDLLANARKMGDYLMNELRALDLVTDVRGRGLMIGIELPAELAHVRGNLLKNHRIFTGTSKGNVIRLLPALNVSQEQCDHFLSAFAKELSH